MTSTDCTAHASELAELEAFLASGRVPLGFFNLSSLDGFLATVLVGPVWMPPEVWLPLVWNCSEPEWLDQDEAGRGCGSVLRRPDQVARQLADDPDSYAPIFRTLPDGTVAADDWARGFLDGMDLCAWEWDALRRDPVAQRFLGIITAQLPDRDEGIMADLGQEAVLEFRRKGRDFIGPAVAQIQRFWAKRRQARQTRRHGHRHGQLALN